MLVLLTAVGAAFKLGLETQRRWLVDSKEEVVAKGSYIKLTELEGGYFSKKYVEDNYLPKKVVMDDYIQKNQFSLIEKELAELNSKVRVANSALKSDKQLLSYREVWHPKNPEFAVKFEDYMVNVNGVFSGTVSTKLPDAEISSYTISPLSNSRVYKFRYEGQSYNLKLSFKKITEDFFLEAVLTQNP
ncbi:hypothetical protein [Pseudomonas sp. IT-P74]|uniref:hypothetical protein n=1 Tax=Pseudomonas sp. IT-P74 TaxID=3026445 RepID=UPI0039E15DB8